MVTEFDEVSHQPIHSSFSPRFIKRAKVAPFVRSHVSNGSLTLFHGHIKPEASIKSTNSLGYSSDRQLITRIRVFGYSSETFSTKRSPDFEIYTISISTVPASDHTTVIMRPQTERSCSLPPDTSLNKLNHSSFKSNHIPARIPKTRHFAHYTNKSIRFCSWIGPYAILLSNDILYTLFDYDSESPRVIATPFSTAVHGINQFNQPICDQFAGNLSGMHIDVRKSRLITICSDSPLLVRFHFGRQLDMQYSKV